MMTEYHYDEQLSRRAAYLRLMRIWWIVPLCAACLAALSGLLYTGVITHVSGQMQYRQTAKLYIDFAWNDQTQKAYDYYNAATWDELLFFHPGIYTTIEEELPEEISLEEADEATKASLISDIRLMTLEVTTDDPQKTRTITKAVSDGIVAFGQSAKEFTAITFLSADEPALVIVSNRTANAIWLGAFLGMLLGLFLVWRHSILNDRADIPEEAAKRYDIPVYGVFSQDPALPEFLRKEAGASLKEFSRIINTGRKQNVSDLTEAYPELKEFAAQQGHIIEDMTDALSERPEEHTAADEGPAYEADFRPADQKAGLTGKTAAIVCCEETSGRRVEHSLEQIRRQVGIDGILLVGADGRFLRNYYK